MAFSFCFRLLLAVTPFVARGSSFLQVHQRDRSLRSAGDWDESEVRLCTFASKAGHENLIKVFADESDNTRYVSFAREGYASDDGFIESMQKCKGAMPEACKHKDTNSSSTSNGCATCPCELDIDNEPFGNYQRRMLELLVPRCQKAGKEPFRVLIVGLGGGALVQYVLAKCPQGTAVDAIEYDPRMVEVASRFFGMQPSPKVFSVANGDGGAVVAAHAKEGRSYDMVLVDAFAGGSHVPETCRNDVFVGNLRKILRKGGSVLHNMAGPTYSNLAGSDDYQVTTPIYQKVFGKGSVDLETLQGNLEFKSHLIVAHAPA